MTDVTLTSRPKADGFRMPGEWEPQECVWLLWPYRTDNWRGKALPAQKDYAAVADAILGATPVCVAVPEAMIADARRMLPAGVHIVAMESDDAWMRDSGPTVVVNDAGERRGVDWIFNSYGGLRGGLYYPWDKDEQVAPHVLAHHGFRRYAAPLVVEGGGIHVDGEGTLMVTEEVHLNSNRNPALTRDQIEMLLSDYLNTSKTIWLPYGVFEDETSGHVDNMCCFARPGEVMLTWTDDKRDPQYKRSKAALDVLEAATDAKGRKLTVHKIQQPGPLYISAEEASTIDQTQSMQRSEGTRMAASYINFLITNKRIIMPVLDPNTDGQAQRQFREIFPDHEIVGVKSHEVLLGGGNIHCITQQIPAGKR